MKKIIVIEVGVERESTLLDGRSHKGEQDTQGDPTRRHRPLLVKSNELKAQDEEQSRPNCDRAISNVEDGETAIRTRIRFESSISILRRCSSNF